VYISRGLDVNRLTDRIEKENQKSALHLAIEHNRIRAANALLKHDKIDFFI
jgi:hypothetical protein